ncbi:MAG: ChbG/HpnK family deacetylase, partial [Terriglobia bacterium]
MSKPLRRWMLGVMLVLFCGMACFAGQKTIAEQLGYPKDAKLLIIHADDLGFAHSVDKASFYALEHHDVSAASVMIPCPWVTEVVDFAREHPGADIGIHLTLNSQYFTYRWGP